MDCQKHLFSLNPKVHYLNCAYKSPLLKAAERAAMNDLIKSRNPVELSIDDFFDEVDKVKEGFGHIVNCHSTNVAIIPSTTYGFSSVLNNIKPKINGHAITIKDEFPSGYFSLKRWCDNYQNDLNLLLCYFLTEHHFHLCALMCKHGYYRSTGRYYSHP